MAETEAILCLEEAFLSGWPAIETRIDGAMRLRYADGYTKRANSVSCLDPKDVDRLAERLRAIAAFYGEKRLRPTIRVTPLAPPDLLALLDRDGWRRFDETLVMTLDLDRSDDPAQFPAASILDAPDDAWIEALGLGGALKSIHSAAFRAMLENRDPGGGFVSMRLNDDPVATAMVTRRGGLAGFFEVCVPPHRRGEGWGRAVMLAGLDWARRNGATGAWLQVTQDNKIARDLYGSLGFRELYRYHYRAPNENMSGFG